MNGLERSISLTYFGSHYELLISGRSSSIRMYVGKSSVGLFACIPDADAGCHLSSLGDAFYNSERLSYALDNPVDGTTGAYALKALSSVLKFD